ncbi:MAG TPA: anti-sigma factor [Mycobacteriales bacterium]|nr:anti-sigma factor [Mycobacteriales bacterium]
MTAPLTPSHEPWDELVAGYAIDALEPEDEALLLGHLSSCERCRAELDDFALVASQLGSLADDEVDPPSWQTVRAHVVGPADELDVRRRRRPGHRQSRLLAAAAAVVVLAAGGVVIDHYATSSSGGGADAALSACIAQPDCSVIRLDTASNEVAAVIVDAGKARLVPLKMAAPSSGRSYAWWQLPRDGSPIFLGSFRNVRHETTATPLSDALSDTAAFAVSIEPAGVTPQRPTDVVAVGANPA